MTEKKIARIRDWVEPAHPMVVKLHDDLLAIYKRIREKYQNEVDKAFDRVSRQIGFVVATTLPVVFEVADRGVVKRISIGAEHLQDTLFDRELTTSLKKLLSDPIPHVSAGTYKLHLLWFEALKLKLRTDWMEPAHFRRERLVAQIRPELAAAVVRPEVREPAHWFDPGTAISAEEAVLISVIDEVYPELRLAERVASYREALRMRVRPEVKEPAHFRQMELGPIPENPVELLRLIRTMLDKYK